MREILQWTTLIVCAAATLARIPSALRGTNRSLFFIFLLATAAGVLSLDVFYLPIDRALGGINIASLLLRLIVFAAIYLVAFRVSRAFGARDAYALISGRIGLGVLGLFSAALVTLFLLMDISASSPGLADASSRSPRNAALLPYYWATARGYPMYVSLALLPSLVRTLGSRLPPLVRAGAGLMAAGAVATTAGFLLDFAAPAVSLERLVVNNSAVLFFASGLVMVWLARVRAQRMGGTRNVMY
ncbi:hypothetical protein ASG92_19880 [Arthrobacter sp. Soil736]|uniref:hypothetical protein n=1 Tax=Arthrobacter sp. Soil736 TaxID=1736395 RepID=UPI0006FA3214|nr:hypothetical protein [Arthrobacter sp. Soil736]KRE63275.1 hypothetical protein ASG92_19880 [Arthrobacter sp. Soil736]